MAKKHEAIHKQAWWLNEKARKMLKIWDDFDEANLISTNFVGSIELARAIEPEPN